MRMITPPLFLALCLFNSCESMDSDPLASGYPRPTKQLQRDEGSAGVYSMGGTSAANPPIKAGETSSAYRERQARQQRESVPDAQVLYQNSASDAFGRSTNTGIIQQSGGVTQEVFIGNQPVYPGQSIYPPARYNGVLQPGYVPSGTTSVYDPVTGRVIPVRRR